MKSGPNAIVLQRASVSRISTLLDLYPASTLRKTWPEKTKAAAVTRAAGDREFAKIITFLRQYVACCKQHIYFFEHECRDLRELPDDVLGRRGELLDRSVSSSGDQASFFYLLDLPFNVLAGDPPTLSTVEFFWPIKISFDRKHAYMRCVTFERDMKPLLAAGTVHYVSKRTFDERDLKADLLVHVKSKGIRVADIQRGIKSLWADDLIDAFKGQFKKAKSTSTETMDEDLLVKRDERAVYEQMIKAPLNQTYFKVLSPSLNLTHFIALPGHGHLTIPTFTEDPMHTEYLVKQIVQRNG